MVANLPVNHIKRIKTVLIELEQFQDFEAKGFADVRRTNFGATAQELEVVPKHWYDNDQWCVL